MAQSRWVWPWVGQGGCGHGWVRVGAVGCCMVMMGVAMVCVCVHAVVLAWYPRRQEFRAAGLSLQVAKPADAAPSGASLFIPEDREDEEEQKKLEEQLQQWRTTDVRPGVFDSQFITSISQPSKKARPKYVYKTVEELKVCACACVYVCTCMHACVCVCMCVHVYVCVCVLLATW